MVFVTFSSLFSFSNVDTGGLVHIPHFDKAVHFTFYFVACILGTFCIRERTKGYIGFVKAVITMGISTTVFGVVIEVLQCAITTERNGDLFDALANTVGSICGVFTMKYLFSGKRQLKWKY